MNSFKIFPIEKSNEDIRKTILTNLVKMLTERKLLKEKDLDANIKSLTTKNSDDYSYVINIDGNKDNEKVVAVKILQQKITAINKQSSISEFLTANKDKHKIVVVKSVSTKAAQYINNNFTRTEIFLEHELLINLVDHLFVPRYEIIEQETEEYKQFFDTFFVKKKNVPKLLLKDPVAKYYNLKKGNIVRVIRPSETTAYSPSYRLVI